MDPTRPEHSINASAEDGSRIGSILDGAVRSRQDELKRLLETLVSIDSQIPPNSDERAIVEFLDEHLFSLGLGRGEIVAADPTRPNLILRIPGAGGGPTLMFNGHVDTKPVGGARDLWLSDPFVPQVRDGRLYGLGSSDMKGAIAAMIIAAAALHDTGTHLEGDLVLSLVADEEAGGGLGSRYLADKIGPVDACLIGEPAGWHHEWQGIHIVSRGVCCFRIRVRGTQMHSSLSDQLPCVNASEKLAALMTSIRDELELDFVPHPLGGVGPTLNVGVLLSGGVFFGVVPGVAEFGCDLRTVPGMTQDSVRTAIQQWLKLRRSADPELDAEVQFERDLAWVSTSELSPADSIVTATQEAARHVLGNVPPLSVFPGSTDATWFANAGIPSMPAFGPGMLPSCHGPNEYVTLDAVVEASRMYARIAASFCGVVG